MRKVYYNFTTNHEILDITGKKKKSAITDEFGSIDNYVESEFDEKTQGYRFEDGQIILCNTEEERENRDKEKQELKEKAIKKLQQKHGFTENDLQDLRLAIQ